MKHKITRIQTSSEIESFIQSNCECGWKSAWVSNMHGAQLTSLSNMEATHKRMQEGEQRLFIGLGVDIHGGSEYLSMYLFWSSERGSYDSLVTATKNNFDPERDGKWDSDLEYWVMPSGKGYRTLRHKIVEKGDEETIARYL